MENTIKTNNDEIKVREESGSISEVTEELLLDARSSLENKKTISWWTINTYNTKAIIFSF